MAPTVCVSDVSIRRTFSLEDHLERALRISHNERRYVSNHPKNFMKQRRNRLKKLSQIMGIIMEGEFQKNLNPYSSTLECFHSCTLEECDQEIFRKKEGLIDIALRTISLLHRNQQLQIKLNALQLETKAFIEMINKQNLQTNNVNDNLVEKD